MSQSFCIGACAAMASMAAALGEDAAGYRELGALAAAALATLWRDDRFAQRRVDPATYEPVPGQSDAAFARHRRVGPLVAAEGPTFQYDARRRRRPGSRPRIWADAGQQLAT